MAARRADLSVEEKINREGRGATRSSENHGLKRTGFILCLAHLASWRFKFEVGRGSCRRIAEEFSCGIAAGPIDGDCLTTLYGGGGRSQDFRETARCSAELRNIIMSLYVQHERMWVGTIINLLIYKVEEGDLSNLSDWTIIINEDMNDPMISTSRPAPGTAGRYCSIGDCPSFAIFERLLHSAGLEWSAQQLAFEICRRAEPRWDEIANTRPGNPH